MVNGLKPSRLYTSHSNTLFKEYKVSFENLEYNQETGQMLWKSNKRGVRKGEAGSVRADGYRVIRINGKLYLAHRVAYFLVKGHWPNMVIDHINGDKSDNRWCNLRDSTYSENNFNKKLVTDGIYEITRKGRKGTWYDVRIQKDGKQYGSVFRRREDALKWRQQKEKELYGDFRREV